MPTSNFNNYYTDVEKLYADKINTAYTDNTNLYTAQADSTNLSYDAQVNNAKSAYEDSYRENAIQKLINERQVAENMANLGLTNSGLNRTQQTAVQLSYANNKADIDKQRQSQIDALNLARTQDLNTIEQNRLASEASIKEYYENLIYETAMNNYTADVEAETERLQAEIEAETERLKAEAEAEAEIEKAKITAENTRKQTKKSDYKDVLSFVSDSSKSNEGKLAQIYQYAVDYDLDLKTKYDNFGKLDIANSTFENSEISALLESAGISLSNWKLYVIEKNGYLPNVNELIENTISKARNYAFRRN